MVQVKRRYLPIAGLAIGMAMSPLHASSMEIESWQADPAKCGDKLVDLQPARGKPGTHLTLVGHWAVPQGPQQAVINLHRKHLLAVQSWSDTKIKATVPNGLEPGIYRVGVYCADPKSGKVDSSGFMNFEVTTP